MIVTPVRTDAIRANEISMEKLLDEYLTDFHEHEVLVVTSKVVSLCEGRVAVTEGNNMDTLLEQEADLFLPRDYNPYGFGISIKNNTMISNGGIDESNGDGYFILWPKDPQASANTIRAYLCNRFGLKEVGVIITDSHVLPLRWGSVGTVIGFSGFLPLKNYIGQTDIFGRTFKVTRGGIAESLAAAAVVVMGEGAEQTPLVKITDLPFVTFLDRDPVPEEFRQLTISMEEDIFAPLLNSVPWKKGRDKS